ncbi:hypothetical protein JB92DRAFT_247974 [Gautieria morchelliformis]|nr:hypothetical protein JB92DRAFT_247974 [Gautieria morchelliformis]
MRLPFQSKPDVSRKYIDLIHRASAHIKTQWQFENGRAAILLMHQVRTTYVPDEFLQVLLAMGFSKEKCLVTEVFTCTSYAMYLSSKKSESVKIALLADLPVPAVPGMSGGGRLGGGWWNSGYSGVFEEAHSHEECFTPLFSAQKIRNASKDMREVFDVPPARHLANHDLEMTCATMECAVLGKVAEEPLVCEDAADEPSYAKMPQRSPLYAKLPQRRAPCLEGQQDRPCTKRSQRSTPRAKRS